MNFTLLRVFEAYQAMLRTVDTVASRPANKHLPRSYWNLKVAALEQKAREAVAARQTKCDPRPLG
jgi:hypothetical protein